MYMYMYSTCLSGSTGILSGAQRRTAWWLCGSLPAHTQLHDMHVLTCGKLAISQSSYFVALWTYTWREPSSSSRAEGGGHWFSGIKGHSYGAQLRGTAAGHSYGARLQVTATGHGYGARLVLDILQSSTSTYNKLPLLRMYRSGVILFSYIS